MSKRFGSRVSLPGPVHLRYQGEDDSPLSMKTKVQKKPTMTSIRSKVMTRDGNACQYCGCALIENVNKTVDHVIPKSRGGLSTVENLVACCIDCNRDKGDKTLAEWVPQRLAIVHRLRGKGQ